MARPTLSTTLYLQMAGRCMRPADGKERPIILDHAGLYYEHGRPEDDRPYELRLSKPLSSTHSHASMMKVCPCCGEECDRFDVHCWACGHTFSASPNEIHETDDLLSEVFDIASITRYVGADDLKILDSGEAKSLEAKSPGMVFRLKLGCICGGEVVPMRRHGTRIKVQCFACNKCEWRTPEIREASMKVKLEEYERLLAVAHSKGFKQGWADYRYRESFGVWPNSIKGKARKPGELAWEKEQEST